MHPSDWAQYEMIPEGRKMDLETIEQEDVINLGGIVLEVFHIPGHTPGSVALLEKDRGWLFPGDSLQEGPIYMFMHSCSLRAEIFSLEKMMGLDFERAFPCHNKKEVDKSFIPELILCAEKILAGELTGEDTEMPDGRKCTTYRHGRVAYYYK